MSSSRELAHDGARVDLTIPGAMDPNGQTDTDLKPLNPDAPVKLEDVAGRRLTGDPPSFSVPRKEARREDRRGGQELGKAREREARARGWRTRS